MARGDVTSAASSGTVEFLGSRYWGYTRDETTREGSFTQAPSFLISRIDYTIFGRYSYNEPRCRSCEGSFDITFSPSDTLAQTNTDGPLAPAGYGTRDY